MRRHRTAPVTVAILVACIAAACSSAQTAREHGAADVPELPEFVKPLEGRTTSPDSVIGTAWLAFCTQQLTGWDVTFDKTPIGAYTIYTDQPGYDYDVDAEVSESCQEEGKRRGYMAEPTSEERRETYPKAVAQHTCLVDLGVPFMDWAPLEPPSIEKYAAEGWSAFAGIDQQSFSTEEIIELFELCGEDRSFELKETNDQ